MTFSSPQRYLLLTLYFILMCVLFTLPGSAFPKSGWLNKIAFDKWVHIGLFGFFTFLTCWAFQIGVKRGVLLTFLTAVIYGIVVEVVQDEFVVNRTFDLGDWAADIVGSFLGVWWWNLRYIKK